MGRFFCFPMRIWHIVAAALITVVLLCLAYQVPARHVVEVGAYDSAYVQNFHDPERYTSPDLAGSGGHARWTRDTSDLLFPQIGLPAHLTLHVRALTSNTVTFLLNGQRLLKQVEVGSQWQNIELDIDDGLLKPNDVFVEIRSPTTTRSEGDQREVGVLVDRATMETTGFPITPYPYQLAYGAIALVLWLVVFNYYIVPNSQLYLKTTLVKYTALPLFVLSLPVAFLLLYRLQPVYPYPLRGLLIGLDILLAMALFCCVYPIAIRRFPTLLPLGAVITIVGWLAIMWMAKTSHTVISAPGVEKDFHVFASRSTSLGHLVALDENNTVLSADEFYNLGYPLMLWLARQFTANNAFLSGQIVALLSGVVLLGSTWWLARQLVGEKLAFLSLLLVVLSAFVVQYALYLGTDMPFAAASTLALALMLRWYSAERYRRSSIIAAGFAVGLAFMIRHPGLLLVLVGIVALLWSYRCRKTIADRIMHGWSEVALFGIAFLVAISPQIIVNSTETGAPLYNHQAKNIWLAVYGNSDWSRWEEERNDISLREVVLRDPGRFLTNWLSNMRDYVGAGSEDTSEFGRSIQIRYIGFPMNWLAVLGILCWCILTLRYFVTRQTSQSLDLRISGILLLWMALYIVGVSVGLWNIRFFLPLVPIYAVAAAWMLGRSVDTLARWYRSDTFQAFIDGVFQPLIIVILIVLLYPQIGIGTRAVSVNQPAAETGVVQFVQQSLGPGDYILVCVPDRISVGKYSVIAHLALNESGCRDAAAVQASGARYLLWSSSLGPSPIDRQVVRTVGVYTLYRIH